MSTSGSSRRGLRSQRIARESSENGEGSGTAQDNNRPENSEQALEAELERTIRRTNTLSRLATEYRRIFGEDFNQWPRQDVVDFYNQEKENEALDRVREAEERPQQGTNNPTPETPPPHERTLPTIPNMLVPTHFEGKTLEDLDRYNHSCNRVFDYYESYFTSDTLKVKWAATLLKGTPADAWARDRAANPTRVNTITWAGYIEFLHTLQMLPGNRILESSRKHQTARQGNYSVREFHLYLERLESNLEPYTELQKKSHFLNAISPALRGKLIENGQATLCQTRDALVEAASLIEQNVRQAHPNPKRNPESKAKDEPEKPNPAEALGSRKRKRPHKSPTDNQRNSGEGPLNP